MRSWYLGFGLGGLVCASSSSLSSEEEDDVLEEVSEVEGASMRRQSLRAYAVRERRRGYWWFESWESAWEPTSLRAVYILRESDLLGSSGLSNVAAWVFRPWSLVVLVIDLQAMSRYSY